MPRKLDTIIDKIKIIQNHLAEEVAPQVNELLKESVRFSLIDWYNDYDPEDYKRTYNFMKILNSTWTSGKGNLLTMHVDSGNMNNYPGWNGYGYGNTYTILGKNTNKKTNTEPDSNIESDENEKTGKQSNRKLNASIAFDFMFMNGEHGHGSWMKRRSLPPYMYVERDIESGFGGRLDKIVNKKIEEILRK